MSSKPPEEIARRILPYMLLPMFKNAITNLPSLEEKEDQIVVRNVEVYYTDFARPFIPSAASLLSVPRIEYTAKADDEEKEITVEINDGFVHGFMPNGRYAKFLAETLTKGNPVTFKYRDSYTDFALETAIRDWLRIKAGALLAYKIKKLAEKHDVKFAKEEKGRISIIISEHGVYSKLNIPTNLYYVIYKKHKGVYPGVVPAIVTLMHAREISFVEPAVQEELEKFIKELVSIGSRVAPISGSLLQQTRKTSFWYVIGELDVPEKKEFKPGKHYITGGMIHRGVRLNIYADYKTKKLYANLTILPFVPPATIVLNYPPFSVMPLSALMTERYRALGYHIGKARKHLRRLGVKLESYDREYRALEVKGIGFEMIRSILKQNYPRFNILREALYKLESLGEIGDLLQLTTPGVKKLDEIVIQSLKKEEHVAEKHEHKEEIKGAEEAEEEVEELL